MNEQDWNQGDLATRSRMDKGNISRYLNGVLRVTNETAKSIIKAFPKAEHEKLAIDWLEDELARLGVKAIIRPRPVTDAIDLLDADAADALNQLAVAILAGNTAIRAVVLQLTQVDQSPESKKARGARRKAMAKKKRQSRS